MRTLKGFNNLCRRVFEELLEEVRMAFQVSEGAKFLEAWIYEAMLGVHTIGSIKYVIRCVAPFPSMSLCHNWAFLLSSGFPGVLEFELKKGVEVGRGVVISNRPAGPRLSRNLAGRV